MRVFDRIREGCRRPCHRAQIEQIDDVSAAVDRERLDRLRSCWPNPTDTLRHSSAFVTAADGSLWCAYGGFALVRVAGVWSLARSLGDDPAAAIPIDDPVLIAALTRWAGGVSVTSSDERPQP